MSSLNPLRDDRTRQKLAEHLLGRHERGLDKREQRARPVAVPHGIRVGKPYVEPDTPFHTPGTNKGEEWALKTKEKGRVGKQRHARSSTSINPFLHDAVDHRMPHLPPA
ncbi:MAG: hypothetical protein ACRD04_07410 [Terriglobales bacterium]